MGRSVKKGPNVDDKLFQKVMKQKEVGKKDHLKTWSRSCTIVPEFVGHWFDIHNGKKFVSLFITEDMVGHKLGEFAPTRVYKGHSGHRKDKGKK